MKKEKQLPVNESRMWCLFRKKKVEFCFITTAVDRHVRISLILLNVCNLWYGPGPLHGNQYLLFSGGVLTC